MVTRAVAAQAVTEYLPQNTAASQGARSRTQYILCWWDSAWPYPTDLLALRAPHNSMVMFFQVNRRRRASEIVLRQVLIFAAGVEHLTCCAEYSATHCFFCQTDHHQRQQFARGALLQHSVVIPLRTAHHFCPADGAAEPLHYPASHFYATCYDTVGQQGHAQAAPIPPHYDSARTIRHRELGMHASFLTVPRGATCAPSASISTILGSGPPSAFSFSMRCSRSDSCVPHTTAYRKSRSSTRHHHTLSVTKSLPILGGCAAEFQRQTSIH